MSAPRTPPPLGPSKRRTQLLAAAAATPGFLPEDEAAALEAAAAEAARSGLGPIVEIGAYLGRSTLYLAAGIAGATTEGATASVLFSVDHHHGSEELQAGWPDHDPALVDGRTGLIDTLGRWRSAIDAAGAADLVVGVLGDSALVARHWRTPVALVFVDGGHGDEVCRADYLGWSPHVATGGLLAFHDVFEDPADGGRPPYECWRAALEGGEFAEVPGASLASLRVLRRIAPARAASGGAGF